jgi:hypothetical protein
MPKDMLDALIERLETEGDQYVRSSSGKAPNIRRASSTRVVKHATHAMRAPHGARLGSRPAAAGGRIFVRCEAFSTVAATSPATHICGYNIAPEFMLN